MGRTKGKRSSGSTCGGAIVRSMMVLCCGLVGVSCQLPMRAAPLRPGLAGPSAAAPQFQEIYQALASSVRTQTAEVESEPLLTYTATEMPLREFLAEIAQRTEVSIVAEGSLDSRAVSIDVREQPVSQVLGIVARRLGVQVQKTKSLYFLGTLRAEDRGVLVRRVRRLASDEIRSAVSVLLSSNGRSESYQDGLLVVGDTVEVLGRVNELLDSIEATDSPTWVVQYHVVSWSDSSLRDFGFDVRPAADVALAFGAASGNPAAVLGKVATSTAQAVSPATGNNGNVPPVTPNPGGGGGAVVSPRVPDGVAGAAVARAGLDAVLRAAAEDSEVSVLAEPCFLLVDGGEGSFIRGDSIPVPRGAISPQGTAVTTGYDIIQTGLEFQTSLREVSESQARLISDMRVSDIKGYVAGAAPITSNESFATTAVITSGGVYLLGSLRRADESKARQAALAVGDAKRRAGTVLQIWVRAYRIGAPVVPSSVRTVAPLASFAQDPEKESDISEKDSSIKALEPFRPGGTADYGGVYSLPALEKETE